MPARRTEEELEQIIGDLVKRKYAPETSEAEQEFIDRVLNGMRYTYEKAGDIWEGLDDYWGATPP